MEVLSTLTKNINIAVALGYFDGIHIGHRKILATLKKYADAENIKSAVITFEDNPANYFSDEQVPAIQIFRDKKNIIEDLGIDYLYELDFSLYKDYSADQYLKMIVEYFQPKFIVVGYNHTFGKDKSGDPSFIDSYSSKYGYECIIVPEQKYDDTMTVSSTIIRKEIKYGNLDTVKALLGRRFSVMNSVVKGSRIARALGYPTANLIWPSNMAKLPYGVYFGYTQVSGKMYPSLISWGTKPTLTNGKEEVLETHIYNFADNLYGKIIKVYFDVKHRDQQNFRSISLLKTNIKKDYAAFEKWARLAI